MNKVVTFIPNAGGSIVSKNILSHKGKLKACWGNVKEVTFRKYEKNTRVENSAG